MPTIFPKFILNKKVFAFYLTVAFFFIFFSFGKIASADISQLVDTDDYGTMNNYFWQEFGTDLSGTLTGFEVNYDKHAGQADVVYTFQSCTNSSYSTCSDLTTGNMNGGSSGAVDGIKVITGLSISLNPSLYYRLQLYAFNGVQNIRGALGNLYSFGSTTASASTPPNGFDAYFILFGGTGTTSTPQILTFSYSTTTRLANVTGYWIATTTYGISQKLSFWQNSDLLGTESFAEVVATTTGNFSFTFEFLGIPSSSSGTTTTQFIAPFTLNASLDEYDENYSDPFGLEGLDSTLYRRNLDATSTLVSTLSYNIPDFTTPRGLSEYPEYECSISSITGCLKNAGIWLFYPSPDSIEQFKSLPEGLKEKFPFVYAFQTNTLLQELFNASSTASSSIGVNVPHFGDIEFLSRTKIEAVPYSNTVKTILGYIAWLMAIQYVYYRVIRSHDSVTPK